MDFLANLLNNEFDLGVDEAGASGPFGTSSGSGLAPARCPTRDMARRRFSAKEAAAAEEVVDDDACCLVLVSSSPELEDWSDTVLLMCALANAFRLSALDCMLRALVAGAACGLATGGG